MKVRQVLPLTLLGALALLVCVGPAAVAQEPPSPFFTVRAFEPVGHVLGEGWGSDSEVLIEIDDPDTPQAVDLSMTAGADGNGFFELLDIPFDIEAGHLVTVSQGATVKTQVVVDLSVTRIDPASDTVSGVGAPNRETLVWVGGGPEGSGRTVVSDDAGAWTADFSVPGREGEPAFDIRPGTWSFVNQPDDDGDYTGTDFGYQPLQGWQHNPATGHDYLYVEDSMSWADAEAYAVSLGGHLVTVNDAAEAQWLLVTFGIKYWIGFNDLAVEGEWRWASGEPVTFTKWEPGQPNDGQPGDPNVGEDAAIMWGDSPPPLGWRDLRADLPQPFVVEAEPAPAPDWTDVPFPPGQHVFDLAQDSRGNIWATTYPGEGDLNLQVLVLKKGASAWEDESAGLAEVPAYDGSLLSIGDKLFINTIQSGCYARSLEDDRWHMFSPLNEPLVFELTEWAGYVWSGAGYAGPGGGFEGMLQLDPEAETWKAVNGGLPLAGDDRDTTRRFFNPKGNRDYLYVGFTVGFAEAEDPNFPGVGVYRLKSGTSAWEDTGLRVRPLDVDLQLPGWRGRGSYWGIQNVIALDGYALCEVSAPIEGASHRLFLYDEQGGTWTPVAAPSSEVWRYFLTTEQGCYPWDGEFYFPVGSTANDALFDVLDPVLRTWRTGVTRPAIAWQPLEYTAYWIAGELLIAPPTAATTPSTAPGFVPSVPLPTQISKDPEVIGTNLALALVFAAIFGFTSTLFNSTIKAKNAEIARLLGPVGRVWSKAKATLSKPAVFRRLASGRAHGGRAHRGTRWLESLAIVIIAGLIYALLDPEFGFSIYGLTIFISLALSIALVTYGYEGVQALISSRRYRAPAAVKLFPIAIGIAIVCVLLSRLTGFKPGYLYGFVGGMAFLGAQQPDDRRKGRLVLLATGCLFVVSLAAWFLAVPLTHAVEAGSSWLKVLQGICVGTFVVGLEGLLFALIPLSVTDGGTLFRWNKMAWAGAFGLAAFLFWHVLLNKNSKYGAAFAETSVRVVVALLVFWTLVTVGTYWYFRKPRGKAAIEPTADQDRSKPA